ncbi:hypothetical protein N8D56_27595 (plasmid) [Devosia sp. A8/3-2]|nr:hypothetical protein N8D56_27595 [Devosia sp. A8/3-2]
MNLESVVVQGVRDVHAGDRVVLDNENDNRANHLGNLSGAFGT